MRVINLAHPFTPEQKQQIADMIKRDKRDIDWCEQLLHLNEAEPAHEQVVSALDALEIHPTGWQVEPIIVNLPGYAPAAACVLAEIEGRRGHLPTIIKMRPVTVNQVRTFEVTEIIDLHHIRSEARTRRLPKNS